MSENKTIKLKFKDKETEVKLFDTLKELISFFKQYFSIEDEKEKYLNLYYFDEDGDQVPFQVETDYDIFKEEETKTIIGEITYKNKEENSIEKHDLKKSKKLLEESIDVDINNNGNYSFDNSVHSNDESLNNIVILQKNSNDFLNEINQMKNIVNKDLDNTKESEIEKMKKEMEDLIKKHNEELKKKEEENEKKI